MIHFLLNSRFDRSVCNEEHGCRLYLDVDDVFRFAGDASDHEEEDGVFHVEVGTLGDALAQSEDVVVFHWQDDDFLLAVETVDDGVAPFHVEVGTLGDALAQSEDVVVFH